MKSSQGFILLPTQLLVSKYSCTEFLKQDIECIYSMVNIVAGCLFFYFLRDMTPEIRKSTADD